MERIKTEHERRFGQSRAVLRLGTTPALRGRFTSAAARIALENPDFMKFELHYEATSSELAQQLRLHRINMAILAHSAIASDASSFAITKLFDDAIAWVVPRAISDDDIRHALAPDADPERTHPVLRRHVEVEGAASTRRASADWYRTHLPLSVPVLTAPTFATCVEFVAEGLATGHMLLSLWPNLSASVRARLRVFEIPGMQRPVVLAMQKHLLSHAGFARVFTDLTSLCRTEYKSEMDEAAVRSFSDLLADLA
jgi:CBS domain-containing protein